MNIKKIIILILVIPILMFIFRYVQLNKADIINTINGMSLEKVKPQYDTYKVNGNITVPFKEVGRSLTFDTQIVEATEKSSIKIDNEVFKPKKSYKYLLIKFKFKIHNFCNDKNDLDSYDYSGLYDTKTNKVYNTYRDKLEHNITIYNQKKDKNLIWLGKLKPGVIKYAYSFFEIPKSCQIKDLVLTDRGKSFYDKHYGVGFKISK